MKRAVYLMLAIGMVGLSVLLVLAGRNDSANANCALALPVQEIGKVSLTNSYRPYKCVVLEKANSEDERVLGLSGRKSMPETAGMLFIFDHEAEQCMWMKDMRFALDMIWLDESSRVTKIERDVRPETYPESFCSTGKYVIEVNAGVAARAGLRVGEQVKLP